MSARKKYFEMGKRTVFTCYNNISIRESAEFTFEVFNCVFLIYVQKNKEDDPGEVDEEQAKTDAEELHDVSHFPFRIPTRVTLYFIIVFSHVL